MSREGDPKIGPKLAAWLEERRQRPEPAEVRVAIFDTEPVPDRPEHGRDARRVAVAIIRYDMPEGFDNTDRGHYVMGLDSDGNALWDQWYETEDDARSVIMSGEFGPAREATN